MEWLGTELVCIQSLVVYNCPLKLFAKTPDPWPTLERVRELLVARHQALPLLDEGGEGDAGTWEILKV